MAKKAFIIVSIIGVLALLAGLGVLIYWLVTRNTDDFETIILEGNGLGSANYTAAFTKISGVGDIFWWFFPSKAGASRPILLFLGGVTGLPHTFLLNFGQIGPLDFNFNDRNDSLVNDYHLLFVDGIPGTGFSKAEQDQDGPVNIDKLIGNLVLTLQSFYDNNNDYVDSPLYIYEQGDGSHLAVPLTIRLANHDTFSKKLKGIFLGNPIISPALVLTKLGFYLEELAMVDGVGRTALEEFSNSMNSLVSEGKMEEAFDQLITLGDFVNKNAGCFAANLGHIVEKLNPDSIRDYFGQSLYYEKVVPSTINMTRFMENVVAPALGINEVKYDETRDRNVNAFRAIYVKSIVDQVENILNNTEVTVTIFNGNLDAISNTPGQLEWVNNLKWPGNTEFRESTRETLIINRQIEGYFRESSRLNFYWINVAGQSTMLDNPVATKKMLERITRTS